jgi:hypothetical protein
MTATRAMPVKCASCGREVARQARRQKFCSARCKERARTRVRSGAQASRPVRAKQNRARANLPTDPPKNINQVNAARRAKGGIVAPVDILDVEVFGGRDWRPATSSGGVSIQVGRLRQRALMRGRP